MSPSLATRAHEHTLDAIETGPRESLEAAALRRLQEVIEQASQLPFYRERFARAGLDARAAADFEQFAARVPTFRKADLIAEIEAGGGYTAGIEALADATPANVVLTSGTLGFPTFASLGPGEFEHGSAGEILREFWMDGMRPGMRVMCQYPGWHHLSLLDACALERMGADCVCPWGTFVPRFAPRALAAIRDQRPEYLLTVTTMLHAIVDEAERRGLDLGEAFGPVRYVMVVGEPVSPAQRERLVEQLGLEDLFERGGSSDGLWGGADCPAHAGHHVWRDHHHVEVIDPDTGQPLGLGQRGSVVVTNLTLDRSLYVRFDTEDLGELLAGECPCGRTHPRVELYGRLADCVRVEGRLVAPYDVRAELDGIPELVGVPALLGRHADDMAALRVYLDGAARADGLAERAAEHLQANLDLAVEVRWSASLPRRWKTRMVRDNAREEPAWARR